MCDMCNEGRDATLARIVENIDKHGLAVIDVEGGGETPGFAYSVGLHKSYGSPEVVVFGLDYGTAHAIINDVADIVRNGGKLRPGDIRKDIFKGYDCAFQPVPENKYEGVLNMASWYYHGSDFPALQLVWPDPQGKLPWQPGYDEKFGLIQPVLFGTPVLMN